MIVRRSFCFVFIMFVISVFSSFSAQAAKKIYFWHSLEGKLGETVNDIAARFNSLHSNYEIIPIYKGNYEQALAAGIAAYRIGKAPAILQVYEIGTATMMASHSIIPVSDVYAKVGMKFDQSDYLPAIRNYFSDSKTGQLISFPFNSSTVVLYYNKDSFVKGGLDPNVPPKTWQEVAAYSRKLRESGVTCGLAIGWQSWVLLESFGSWHAVPYATRNNGFDGLDTNLVFNAPTYVNFINFMISMYKNNLMSYFGRKEEATQKFYSGDCSMIIGSSSSLANIEGYAKFKLGVGSMPYDNRVAQAPQNVTIGGGSLWVMKGEDDETYIGVAEFLDFLASPPIAAEWHQRTDYLPIKWSAYELTKQAGAYDRNPNLEVAVRQLINSKPELPFTKGIRLGNFPQIRIITDEELENVWMGVKSPQDALNSAVRRGDLLLRRFESNN